MALSPLLPELGRGSSTAPITTVVIPRVEISPAVRRLSNVQDGVVSRAQMVGLGVSDKVIARWVREERWTRLFPGVYLRGITQPSFRQMLWSGVLLGGEPSAVGGWAALHHHGIAMPPGIVHAWDARRWDHGPAIEIVVPRSKVASMPRPFVPLRDARGRLDRARGQLPVVAPHDAIFDALVGESVERFVGVVTDAVRLGLVSPGRLEWELRLRAHQPGKTEWLHVLADLQGIESNLEFVFRRDVERAHQLPRPTRQAKVRGSRFDMLYEKWGVVAEVDGKRGHLDGRFRDFERDNSHAAQALITLRYGSYDIRGHPCAVAQQIGKALQLRGWDGAPGRCPECPSQIEC